MTGSLFLTPVAIDSLFNDLQQTEILLRQLGLIDMPYEQAFLCGDSFAQLITFMGCSPYLQFEPPADGSKNFCHVSLHHFEQPRLFTGKQTTPPRCPQCRHRFTDWRERLHEPTASFNCPGCSTAINMQQLDWRQSAGAGHFFIEIHNIFPGEAVPVDKLMENLQMLANENWRYFYTAC